MVGKCCLCHAMLCSLLLTVTVGGQQVFVRSVGSQALIVRADNFAGDSILHIIDNVLLPFTSYSSG